MKIVILERKNIGADIDLSKFEKLTDEVVIYESTTQEQFAKRAKDAEVIVLNKLLANEETMQGLEKVRLICITATGSDNVDLAYCTKRGIRVCNVRGYSTESVVQHTFASLFYLYEKLPYYDQYVKDGEYVKCDIFCHLGKQFFELSGKVWGIVGLGDIGRRVADVAKAFGCRVIYYSTSGKNNQPGYERVDFDTLLQSSDIVSIHAPLTNETRNLFTRSAFEKMKPSAYLINVGRGPIVNEQDLVDALDQDLLAGAALDVISKEPMAADNPLLTIRNKEKLLVTPHIAWGTLEARTRLMDEVYESIVAYINGTSRNALNEM